MRVLGPLLGASIGIAAVAWWPDLSEYWRALDKLAPPIYIPDATATWVNDRQFDIEAPAFYWNDTCPSIWVNWWVQTRHRGNVAVTTRAVSGPFVKRGDLPSSYRISITPQVGPPLQLRVTIPEELPASEVLLVGVDDTVPDDEPCASGWFGVMQVFRLEIKPPPASGGSESRGSRN